MVGVSAVSGAAALPGSAVADSTTHTKKLVLHETASHRVGKNGAVGTDVARAVSSHAIVGYDSYSARVYPKQQRLVFQVALSLKGGIIVSRLSLMQDETQTTGLILTGTGKYRGIDGTMNVRTTQQGQVYATLHYQL